MTVMDETDEWDVWLVEKFGKPLVAASIKGWKEYGKGIVPAPLLENQHDPKFLFEEAIGFLSGRQYEDGFGPWGDLKSYTCVVEPPVKIFSPAELEKYLKGSERYSIDWFAQGQPDGPQSPGTVWVARIWDNKRKRELPKSRFVSDKLSWVMSAVAQLL